MLAVSTFPVLVSIIPLTQRHLSLSRFERISLPIFSPDSRNSKNSLFLLWGNSTISQALVKTVALLSASFSSVFSVNNSLHPAHSFSPLSTILLDIAVFDFQLGAAEAAAELSRRIRPAFCF